MYFLPFLPVILGIVGLITAKDSVNPERTKLLAWFSLGSGALILLLILLVVIAYIGLIAVAVTSEGQNFR
jgi:amino acid transporter